MIEVRIKDTQMANEAPANIEKFISQKLKEAGIPEKHGDLRIHRDDTNEETVYIWREST